MTRMPLKELIELSRKKEELYQDQEDVGNWNLIRSNRHSWLSWTFMSRHAVLASSTPWLHRIQTAPKSLHPSHAQPSTPFPWRRDRSPLPNAERLPKPCRRCRSRQERPSGVGSYWFLRLGPL